ncbi:hypothetical protein [Saccharopolyspora shandongensis]|uniref:hypothetical protein n=1 Tax=Saccharopolyspora shandongensis TaxID=418495 RepID=UPI0033E3D473
MDAETSGDRTLGQMIVDTRPWSAEPATAASAEVFREVLRDAFGNTVRDLRGSTS